MTSQMLFLNDEVWERISELTGGAMDPCYQCGTCTATCPWGFVSGKPLNVRKLLRSAQLGVDGEPSDLWLCSTCKYCEERCPRQVEIVRAILGLRTAAFEDRKAPDRLVNTLWSVFEDGNPWGGASRDRGKWAEGLEVPSALNGVKVLLYVGCTASYDPRIQNVARSLVKILRSADIDFGILGSQEKCCGDVVRSVGEQGFLEELVEKNVETFNATGAETVVTVSPHCLEIFSDVYSGYGAEFRATHYTEFLADLLDRGTLRLSNGGGASVTYHDPCYLGRYLDVYDPPRRLLEAIPGVNLVEMKNSKNNAICCGGGGGGMWIEVEAEKRLADLRTEEARETQATVIATACPFCIINFEDSLKKSRVSDVSVRDVAELVERAL